MFDRDKARMIAFVGELTAADENSEIPALVVAMIEEFLGDS